MSQDHTLAVIFLIVFWEILEFRLEQFVFLDLMLQLLIELVFLINEFLLSLYLILIVTFHDVLHQFFLLITLFLIFFLRALNQLLFEFVLQFFIVNYLVHSFKLTTPYWADLCPWCCFDSNKSPTPILSSKALLWFDLDNPFRFLITWSFLRPSKAAFSEFESFSRVSQWALLVSNFVSRFLCSLSWCTRNSTVFALFSS